MIPLQRYQVIFHISLLLKTVNLFYSLLFILTTFTIPQILAQSHNIQGKVLDKISQSPLPATSIYYKDGIIGTISNADGEFILEKKENKIVVFSYLGYEVMEYYSNNLPQIIYLTPSTIQLPEVVVMPINEKELIKKVWNKYYTIYQMEKKEEKNNVPATFLYRQVTKSDTTYNEFTECFFTGANTYGAADFRLQKGRYAKIDLSPDFHFTFTNFFQFSQIRPFHQKNPPKNVFNTFLQPNSEKLFNIHIEGITHSSSNGNVVTLSFTPKKNNNAKHILEGRLHIQLEDLSILKMEGRIRNVGIKKEGVNNSILLFIVNYKKGVKSYPIVESVKCNATFDILYNNTMHTANIESILFDCSYKFSRQTGRKIKDKDFLLESIDNATDSPEFWENNPIVKRTAKEENIIKTFENKNVFGNFQIN